MTLVWKERMASERAKALIVGAGIGGLATALACHRRGVECEIYEQSDAVRELGVGINILPNAVRELRDLGLLGRLDQAGVRTHELFYLNRHGQQVWHELRGTDAGHEVPQYSIHRGHLLGVLYGAVRERLGDDAVRTGRRLTRFTEQAGGVAAVFSDRSGREVGRAGGDVLIGADGIRSTVRAALNPAEGDPLWNGAVLWRGTSDWPAFLTGRSMLIAGGLRAKAVIYPVGPGQTPATRLTNWAVIGVPERRDDRWLGDWSRPGSWDELRPFVEPFRIGQVDVLAMASGTPVFYEYPLCDRDRCPGGHTAVSRCSATRPTPCIPSVRTVPRKRSSTRAAWPTGWPNWARRPGSPPTTQSGGQRPRRSSGPTAWAAPRESSTPSRHWRRTASTTSKPCFPTPSGNGSSAATLGPPDSPPLPTSRR